MGDSNCCSKCHNLLIIILLAVNTFFLGSIWCTLSKACHKSGMKGMCPITGKMMPQSSEVKMCPISGHSMEETPVAK